jgi:hypothetical protein
VTKEEAQAMTERGEAVDVGDNNDPADGVFAAQSVEDEIQANSWYRHPPLIKPSPESVLAGS